MSFAVSPQPGHASRGNLRIQVTQSQDQWAAAAAEHLACVLRAKPEACIGWPTGSTPLPLYAALRRRAAAGTFDASGSRAAMLDEYVNAPEEFSSYRWLRRQVWAPLGIATVLRITEDGEEFERVLRTWGGCALQLLGLGANGHIAFNEPGAAVDSRTRAVKLTAETAAANAAYWGGRFTPAEAVTMGMATILEASAILLLVRGAAKAGVLRRMLQEPIGPQLPATFLREHKNVTIVADQEAAAEL
ncbi:MAG: 6-phosphogluconolactonase [Terriglobales bacterium]